ncbi:MAG: T9SS type A sorting domain-containing protein [Bacteroidia bacterium]
MRKLNLFFLMFCFLGMSLFSLKAQHDTSTVQIFTFADICKRSGTFQFPPASKKWEKVLMYYTLKCDPATVWDQYPCGEWDYLTYTVIYDSTGIIDTTTRYYPNYQYLGMNPNDSSNFYFTNQAGFDVFQQHQKWKVIDATTNETTYPVGTAVAGTTFPITSAAPRQRMQFLWLASELTAAGMGAGSIDALNLDITSLGGDLENLTIRMKPTTLTSLSKFDEAGFSTVYWNNMTFAATGAQRLDLLNSFAWNGTSNVLVEFSFTDKTPSTNHELAANTTTFNSAVTTSQSDGYFQMDKDWIEIDNAASVFSQIDSQITISFWAYGDASMPQQTTGFEGVDANNARILNTHLPWDNGNVYWDAGRKFCTDGTYLGYERIDKAVSAADYKGTWTHWAFSKDVYTGLMNIYKNGVIFHSGSGKWGLMDGIEKFVIGYNQWNSNNVYFRGRINDFQIWKTTLSTSEIATWMYKDITPTHPKYSKLLVYYPMDNMSGNQVLDASPNGFHATIKGSPNHQQLRGHSLYRNFTASNQRPVMSFISGTYQSHQDSSIVQDTLWKSPTSIMMYANGNPNTIINTMQSWNEGYNYTYLNGTKIDSTLNPATDSILYEKYSYETYTEKVNQIEIGRFITPYGINLSLGNDGFTWIYDVTDYAGLLHDYVRMSAANTQELADIKFVMVEGTPPREVVQINHLENMKSYSYSNIANNNAWQAKTLTTSPTAEQFKLITRITGHGHEGIYDDNLGLIHCCEWADKEHFLTFNGAPQPQITWDLKVGDRCSMNPVGGQGGNWAPARDGGWCPADPVPDHEFEVTPFVQNNQVTIDYGIEPVPANNMGQGSGNYVTTMQLVEYKNPSFQLDAAMDQILMPNNWDYLRGENPICNQPKIRIKNTGTTPITSVNIEYGINGGASFAHQWTGNLVFLESATLELPFTPADWATSATQKKFWAHIKLVNGQNDAYQNNNNMYTTYDVPPTLGNKFLMQFRTNAIPNDLTLTIQDVNGTVFKSYQNPPINTLYQDTIDLPDGCYQLKLTTVEGLGLSYPLIPQVGGGYLRLKKLGSNQFWKMFPSDFGKQILYNFTASSTLPITDAEELAQVVALYPNPTQGSFVMQANAKFSQYAKIEVTDITGRIIYANTENHTGYEWLQSVDIQNESAGIYFVRVYNGSQVYTAKLVKE